MTAEHEELRSLVPSSGAAPFLEGMAEKLGVHAKASAVFADPVERDGVTVIPVAKVRWGFGGGGGSGRGRAGETGGGSGGGGGVMASPMGYIEIANGRARFRRITDPSAAVPLILAGGIIGLLFLRAVTRLVRETRRR